MDDYLPTMLIIVLCINLVLFLGQAAVSSVSADVGGSGTFYTPQGSLLCKFDANGCNNSTSSVLKDQTHPETNLPSAQPVTAGDGSLFTDMFSSISSWFTKTLGLDYLTNILSAPMNLLGVLGLPQTVVWALGALWYAFSLFIIIAFFWGR